MIFPVRPKTEHGPTVEHRQYEWLRQTMLLHNLSRSPTRSSVRRWLCGTPESVIHQYKAHSKLRHASLRSYFVSFHLPLELTPVARLINKLVARIQKPATATAA